MLEGISKTKNKRKRSGKRYQPFAVKFTTCLKFFCLFVFVLKSHKSSIYIPVSCGFWFALLLLLLLFWLLALFSSKIYKLKLIQQPPVNSLYHNILFKSFCLSKICMCVCLFFLMQTTVLFLFNNK